MVQQNAFHGQPHEDAVQHLYNFEEFCAMLNINNVSQDNIKLMSFTFSLADKAKSWLRAQKPESIDTWQKLSTTFLNQFFPPSKTNAICHQIHNFKQNPNESMAAAFERFNELQRSCPHHNIARWELLRIFYGGLRQADKKILDAASGGCLLNKGTDPGFATIEEMTDNHDWEESSEPQSTTIVTPSTRKAGVLEVDVATKLQADMFQLNKKVDGMCSKMEDM